MQRAFLLDVVIRQCPCILHLLIYLSEQRRWTRFPTTSLDPGSRVLFQPATPTGTRFQFQLRSLSKRYVKFRENWPKQSNNAAFISPNDIKINHTNPPLDSSKCCRAALATSSSIAFSPASWSRVVRREFGISGGHLQSL